MFAFCDADADLIYWLFQKLLVIVLNLGVVTSRQYLVFVDYSKPHIGARELLTAKYFF